MERIFSHVRIFCLPTIISDSNSAANDSLAHLFVNHACLLTWDGDGNANLAWFQRCNPSEVQKSYLGY